MTVANTQQLPYQWMMSTEELTDELYKFFPEHVEGDNYEGEVRYVTSASMAQFLTVNLNKTCICTGLHHKLNERFWIFIMTTDEAIDALVRYKEDFEGIRYLFD